jgi:hypothetical protein
MRQLWMWFVLLIGWPAWVQASTSGVFAPVAVVITSGVNLSYIVGTLIVVVIGLWAIFKFINRDLQMGEALIGMVGAVAAGIFFFVIVPGVVAPGVALGATVR